MVQLRKETDFKSPGDLIVSDKIFETLDREFMSHIGVKQGEASFKPQRLGRECDIYLSSRASIETISHPCSSRRAGRPQKDFESCSTKTKRQTIQHILETSSQEEISMADEVQLRREGKRDSAAIVKEFCDFSPKRGTTIRKARKRFSNPKQSSLSEDQASSIDGRRKFVNTSI
ncbi:hypothetical protein AVEN_268672-1 [Araneus ventricosus]|uniref:Uncharacterized protein n=1 Tax=Araneus ventricosus TaxID=182803 RepID=A0A4Y2Q6P5_ARAVE|nr:hypothetical protein AVEN_268672-1 [Araneus ventricosus]